MVLMVKANLSGKKIAKMLPPISKELREFFTKIQNNVVLANIVKIVQFLLSGLDRIPKLLPCEREIIE